jgi:mRNA interferase MazF
MKKFDDWNEVKQHLDSKEFKLNFKEREIYWASIGENIGFEQNGKGKDFSRPLLIVKKLNKQLFLGVPLSTTIREGSYYYNFSFLEDEKSSALLVQVKVYDLKRIDRKIGMINKNDFENLKVKLRILLDL